MENSMHVTHKGSWWAAGIRTHFQESQACPKMEFYGGNGSMNTMRHPCYSLCENVEWNFVLTSQVTTAALHRAFGTSKRGAKSCGYMHSYRRESLYVGTLRVATVDDLKNLSADVMRTGARLTPKASCYECEFDCFRIAEASLGSQGSRHRRERKRQYF